MTVQHPRRLDQARPSLASLEPDVPRQRADVIASIPRRKVPEGGAIEDAVPPMARVVHFEAGKGRSLVRLLVWSWAAFVFALGTFFDILFRRDGPERRAERL